jgi:hypothetical protein
MTVPLLAVLQFHFYADDLQLYISGCKNGLDILVVRLNDDLLAAQKSQALVVAKVSTPHTLSGLNSGLVTNICSKIYGMLHGLRLLKYLTPKHIRLKLCKALLLPTFFYSDITYTDVRSVDSRPAYLFTDLRRGSDWTITSCCLRWALGVQCQLRALCCSIPCHCVSKSLGLSLCWKSCIWMDDAIPWNSLNE